MLRFPKLRDDETPELLSCLNTTLQFCELLLPKSRAPTHRRAREPRKLHGQPGTWRGGGLAHAWPWLGQDLAEDFKVSGGTGA
eukprot:12683670-Alexandrium_andersonii.AAC.1